MALDVLPLVEELALAGSSGFRASFVAGRLAAPEDDVRIALLQLVDGGELELKLDLICPDNGRTIRSYTAAEQLPLGEMESSGACETDEPFLVDKTNIWLTYVPTLTFVQRVNREQSRRDKKKPTIDPGASSALDGAADRLQTYEDQELIRQTRDDRYVFNDCEVHFDTSQTAATDGSAIVKGGGAAATSGSQALSAPGTAASGGSTALSGGSVFTMGSKLRRSKLSLIAGSLGLLALLITILLLALGQTDIALAGFLLTVIALVLAAVPLLRRSS